MKRFLPLIVCSFAAFAGTPADNSRWQPIDSVAAAAKAHAEKNGLRVGVRQNIEAGPLDERLLLTRCSQELTTAFAPGLKTASRMTVEVRCPGSGGWRVFVPVQVKAFDKAVVATRALERGHVLSAGDVTLMENQVSDLPNGYFSDPAKAEGLRLERPVAAGTVLTSAVLHIEPLVRRGDRVTVIAQAKGMSIRAQAVALNAGARDDRIRIKNLSSGKEVEGVVRDTALVEISVH